MLLPCVLIVILSLCS